MPSPSARPRLARKLLLLLGLGILLPLGILEGVARRYTLLAPNGMPSFRLPGLDCALLPFRPPAEVTGDWVRRSHLARFIVLDSDLGWTVTKGGRFELEDSVGRPLLYTSNAQGFRAEPEREYATEVPAGRERLVVCGDSFTFGADLPLEATWTSRLEALDPTLEVLNLGVQAYGTDQAVLRWERDGRPFAADRVWLCIWPEDVLRNLSLFRYYIKPRAGYVMAKPRFVLADDGSLELLQALVPDPSRVARTLSDPASSPLVAQDGWYDPRETRDSPLFRSRLACAVASLNVARKRQLRRLAAYADPGGEATELAVAIARRFADEVRATGARPAVVVLPQQDLLEIYPGDGDLPLVRRLREAGIETIDLVPAFTGTGAPLDLFFPSGHFDEEGARVVAEALHAHLRSET